ncbi:cobalamin biosynthesis protein [Synechococcus phage S-M1]|uniref:AAA+ ATPase domain-containing protein n=1 Tax=Synechococcus phage QB2 TaxID=3159453 RepID=A0AAU8EJM8_9CAUD|nr:cobalamin biosynthesis protein [Synechococcus phage S-M1]
MPRKSELTTANLVDHLTELHGPEVDVVQVRNAADYFGVSYPTACKRLDSYKSGRGKWNLTVQEIQQAYEAPSAISSANYIPEKDDSYVQFGNFQSVRKVVQSRQFYPIFITGLSGNGKTMSVEQACAATKRELIRVNITIETDEDDLIGGFRLVNGDTVWHNGPVIEALERGAVLLLDEIDLASNKILCLQSVLEGKGVFLKKTGRYVRPAAGFTVIATANTKGKGSDDGRFVGTNILNEAFLERFPVTFEQDYPTATVETKILQNAGADDQFAENLVKWAGVIRKTFFDGGVDEVITTRRLVHIVQAYSIFGDRLDAITKCVNRFDDDTKQSFLDLYTKVDAGEDSEYNENEAPF